jgi:hypothetical protein
MFVRVSQSARISSGLVELLGAMGRGVRGRCIAEIKI